MGNKRYRQDANKAAQSKSQTMRRKSSREPTSSDPKEQHNVVLPELGEKPRDMSSSQRSTESGSSRSSQRCSSYRESSQRSSSRSSKVSISVRDELEDKMDRMQASDLPSASSLKKKYGSRGNHATSQRSSSNTSEAYRSSRSGRQRSSRSCSSSGRHRRRVDMDGKVPHDATTVDNASLVYNTDSELSIDESTPGAYRVGSMGRISTLSPASHYEQSDGSHSDEERDLQAGVPPRSSRSRGSQSNAIESTLGSVSENTMVEAVAAQDIEDELNAARQRGRQEAMSEVARTDIAVAVAHDDDDNSRKGIDEAEARKRKKKFIVLFALFLIAIGVTTTMLLLFGRKQDAPAQLKNTEDSNAKVVVVYIPPTKEECEAIANGTFLGDQQSLIQKSFDIRIDITLGSENDFGPLFSAMLNHIQEKLIPIMAGCGAIDFFDTTMAITDELKNATNSIVNGKVEKESEKQCDGSNGNCRSYVLVLDLYLKEEQSSVSLMEVIGSAMNGDKLVNALGDFYPVETASVPWIIPSNSSIVVTSAPSVLEVVTAVPTQAPDSALGPTFGSPQTPATTQGPTSKIETSMSTMDPEPNNPTNAPTQAPAPNKSPNQVPTASPTKSPTAPQPTGVPTLTPSTRTPTLAPTKSPTKGPTKGPTKTPTAEPSSSPSISTLVPTTGSPTVAPAPDPTELPSITPSKAPTPPPTLSPVPAPSPMPTTMEPSEAPVTTESGAAYCCTTDYQNCGNLVANCHASQSACVQICNAHWMQVDSCTEGLVKFSECTNDVSGCCPPAVCTSLGPTYSQCQ
ncbi:unnamed protein product [Cylindrotheca closterium]|uniref:Uncharacterized protein n=1 Tax=Cylindrotheca closterium TaxID=2856 RepID=A0AAD2G625_9STRA|nr:unnamed protein product [Cylindrotheca closterium]